VFDVLLFVDFVYFFCLKNYSAQIYLFLSAIPKYIWGKLPKKRAVGEKWQIKKWSSCEIAPFFRLFEQRIFASIDAVVAISPVLLLPARMS
jgi:hypothetical protein